MSYLTTLLHDGAFVATASGTAYIAAVTAAALTAVFAREPARRRDARLVLKILLRRHCRQYR